MKHADILTKGAEILGIKLSDEHVAKFGIYINEIKLWAHKINITGIKDEKEIIINHFLDSLTIKKHLKTRSRLIDIGTGAGFPGVPLAIIDNTLDVTVIDSVGKKIFFVRNALRAMNLTNVKAVRARADDSLNGLQRCAFDYAVTRAVSSIEKSSDLSKHYIKGAGTIILMRGKDGIDEWNSLEQRISARYMLDVVDNAIIPFSGAVRTNLFLRKIL